jgi:hypothetical protein
VRYYPSWYLKVGHLEEMKNTSMQFIELAAKHNVLELRVLAECIPQVHVP